MNYYARRNIQENLRFSLEHLSNPLRIMLLSYYKIRKIDDFSDSVQIRDEDFLKLRLEIRTIKKKGF